MIAYRNKAIFNLLLNSGMRVNEMCKITFKDVEIKKWALLYKIESSSFETKPVNLTASFG